MFHNNQTTTVYSIKNKDLKKTALDNANPTFPVQTDKPDTYFSVSLKPSLEVEAGEFGKPEKVLALSDIEGNFSAFRKLLQGNKVIDEKMNWIFGKGHLIFVGDMFDRGFQVAECLWLIYSLEEKAKAAGGYVHFILGNHEIMNLQGDYRYNQPKYKSSALLMGKKLNELYDENSELGRWLRTKNVIEKIGDNLYVHAGMAREIDSLDLSVQQINELARPYYGKNFDFTDPRLAAIYNSRTSPFWFRGYYGDLDNREEIPTREALDVTLKRYNVAHIITGHTIVADSISTWYNGKVINLDTKHAKGKSEALLIIGDSYFRVNGEGDKKVIF